MLNHSSGVVPNTTNVMQVMLDSFLWDLSEVLFVSGLNVAGVGRCSDAVYASCFSVLQQVSHITSLCLVSEFDIEGLLIQPAQTQQRWMVLWW